MEMHNGTTSNDNNIISVYQNNQSNYWNDFNGSNNVVSKTLLINNPQYISDNIKDVSNTYDNTNLIIGSSNVIRENCVISLPFKDMTILGDNNYIMTNCIINHDAHIGSFNVLSSGVILAGFVTIMNHVNIGQGSSIHQHTIIGSYSMIGMNSSITKHILPFSLYNPKYPDQMKLNKKGISSISIDCQIYLQNLFDTHMMKDANRMYSYIEKVNFIKNDYYNDQKRCKEMPSIIYDILDNFFKTIQQNNSYTDRFNHFLIKKIPDT